MRTEALFRRRRGYRFFADRRGVAAVEFAMVVPFLVALYMGSVDLCLGITLQRKVQHSASVMNDLATRENNLTKADLNGIFDIGDAVVNPRESRLDTSKISGVYVDGEGKAKISWSQARRVGADTVGSAVTLPASFQGIKDANLVWTSVSYRYAPIGTFGFVDPFAMKQDVFAKARVGQSVVCSDC